MKNLIFIAVLVIVFGAVIWFLGNRQGGEIAGPQATPTPSPEASEGPTPSLSPTPTPTPEAVAAPKTVIINMTESEFEPKEVTINAGDTVRFVNQGLRPIRPASGIHPTHDLYPQKGGCISSAFDVCRGLQKGESFSFTFSFKGTWPFHDHLNPSLTGKIIVQ